MYVLGCEGWTAAGHVADAPTDQVVHTNDGLCRETLRFKERLVWKC